MTEISIVIPCRNEVNFIEECITAIYNSTLDFEVNLHVFVVDGMSVDGTREKVKELQKKFNLLQLIDNKKKLTPFAFNLGIKAQEFDFVQIVGARHILSSNYLGTCLDKLKSDTSIWCVGGKIANEFSNQDSKVIALAMGTTFGMGLGNFRTLEKSGFTDTVTSPMYPAKVFEKLGFFDEELVRNQDDDFNFRVAKAGGKIFYDASISLKYYVRASFSGLRKQFFQYGYWKVYVNRKHRNVTTSRQLVPPIFVLYLLFLPFLMVFVTQLIWLFVLPLLFYVILNMGISVKMASKEKDVSMWKLFLTFLLMHIFYGTGYLLGVFHFLIFNKKPSDRQKTLSR